MAFSQVVRYVNVVAFIEQNVESELYSQVGRVGYELGLECLSCLRQWQDIAFLLVSHTFKTFFLNGYNTFYHKGILKMEQKLGGVAIPQSKTLTSKLTGWSEQGTSCQACLSWPTGPAGVGVRALSGHKAEGFFCCLNSFHSQEISCKQSQQRVLIEKREGYLDSLPLRQPFMKKKQEIMKSDNIGLFLYASRYCALRFSHKTMKSLG